MSIAEITTEVATEIAGWVDQDNFREIPAIFSLENREANLIFTISESNPPVKGISIYTFFF